MSKVTFRARQKYFSLGHCVLFPECANMPSPFHYSETLGKEKLAVTGDKLEEIKKLPDWEMICNSYKFIEGAEHNEFTTDKKVVIDAIRAYIQSRNDTFIVELDEAGKEIVPEKPEGAITFTAREPLAVITPAMYMGRSDAEGTTFRFNQGANQNQYSTADPEEIKILRAWVIHCRNCNSTKISEGEVFKR